MSVSYEMDFTRAVQRKIVWDETRIKAATLLALGHSKSYTANEIGVTRATIYNWLDDPEFAAEVDRLSIMTGVSSRAERLRIAMRIVRQRTTETGEMLSDKDLLDWLKFAQSETDGAKIDLSKLSELMSGQDVQQERPATPQIPAIIETQVIEPTVDSATDDESCINPT